jgi:hypothetical protein
MRRHSGNQRNVIPQFKVAEVSMRMRAAEFLSADPHHLLFSCCSVLFIHEQNFIFSTVPFMGVRSIPMNNLLVPPAADLDTLAAIAAIASIAAQSRPVEAIEGNHDEAEKRNDKAR